MRAAWAIRRHKMRIDTSRFASLIATPASGTVVLPGNARVALRVTVNKIAGALLATLTTSTTREFDSRGLTTGQQQVIDYVEQGASFALEAGVELYIDSGLGMWSKIGEGAG